MSPHGGTAAPAHAGSCPTARPGCAARCRRAPRTAVFAAPPWPGLREAPLPTGRAGCSRSRRAPSAPWRIDTPDGARWRAFAESRDRFHRDLLGEVFGIGAVADPGVDERVHDFELVQRDIRGAGRHRELEQITLLVRAGLLCARRMAWAHLRPSGHISWWTHTVCAPTQAG